eukprot:SAG11_NODE_1121_length_5789_cov_2.695079_3_plen_87_part_00
MWTSEGLRVLLECVGAASPLLTHASPPRTVLNTVLCYEKDEDNRLPFAVLNKVPSDIWCTFRTFQQKTRLSYIQTQAKLTELLSTP